MRVHVIRTEGCDLDLYNNVLNLLRSFSGTIHYCSTEEAEILEHVTERNYEDRDSFEFSSTLGVFQPSYLISESREITFPHIERETTWQDLFDICKNKREKYGFGEEDYVILLTDISNDKNWFGGIDESMRNIFVHTSNWFHYFGSSVDDRFPIAYEVAAWLMRASMFPNREAILVGMHQQAKGCIMDFCKDKKEIVLKMRTADVCESCLDTLAKGRLLRPQLQQLFETMDGIRSHLMFRKRSNFFNRPSRIEIRDHSHRIFLTDLGDLEVKLNPKEKTLFLFYLAVNKGVTLPELSDYRDQLAALYRRFSTSSEPVEIERALDRLISPLESNQQQVLSRIRKKFRDLVGRSMAEFYTIEVSNGVYNIAIDRTYVTWKVD